MSRRLPKERVGSAARNSRAMCERLERRTLLSAVFNVTNTNNSGAGSLRQAIVDANASFNIGGPDEIRFNLGFTRTIVPSTILPSIIDPVVIDGTSDPSFAGAPVVEINGNNAGFAGLVLGAGSVGSTIRGLVINRFSDALQVNSGGNTIAGNYIGTDVTGLLARGNVRGIVVNGTSNNIIGGSSPADRNVVSAQTGGGIVLLGGTANQIKGNYVGLGADGAANGLGNGTASAGGISLSGASGNFIGGSAAGEGNVVSNNGGIGIYLISGSSNNLIQGNYIGTDATGTLKRANQTNGIQIDLGSGNIIGGSASGEGNLISGNGQNGIQLTVASAATRIEGNFIGTDVGGTLALGNQSSGVKVTASANNTIGGTASGAGNVISGNVGTGITVEGTPIAQNNKIQGNRIGTDFTGTAALGNVGIGIYASSASNTTIGGTDAGAGNVISNNYQGILMDGSFVTGNVIQGNLIGTDITGTVAMGNLNSGISLFASGAIVGGTTPGARNVISANNNGIFTNYFSGSGSNLLGSIIGNYIGTDITGSVALGNTLDGIVVSGARSFISSNVISGNRRYGLFFSGDTLGTTTVQSNYIGVAADGATPLGNVYHGIYAGFGATGLLIGSETSTGGNIIANNGANGINLSPIAGTNIRTPGNSIYDNVGLGIDIGGDGVTANDVGDADTGPGQWQNYPVLSSIIVSGGTTTITGTLNSVANTEFWVEFYQSPDVDSSGYGEGRARFLRYPLSTGAGGNGNFSIVIPTALPIGAFISAIADVSGSASSSNTSEFSQSVQVLGSANVSIADATVVEGSSGTTNLVFTVVRTGYTGMATSVLYSTEDGTATSPGDYVPINPTLLTFAAGETSKTITVPINGDTISEPNETLFVNLITPVNAVIVDAQARGTIVNDDADLSPPTVLTSLFNFVGVLPNPYEVQITLNEPVIASGGGVPLLIRRVDNGQLVATVMANIQSGNIVRGLMNTPLPDGNYRATLPAGAVIDLASNALAQDVVVDFFILGGDANRDRKVDISDLYTLSSNWQGTTKTFGQGDFNYDGKVDASDLAILAARWQQNLPPPAPALTSLPQLSAVRRTPVRVASLVI